MKNLIDKWMAFIEDLVKEWPEKDISRTWIKVSNKALTIDSIAKEEVFLICKYQNPMLKMTQLEAQYLDKKSFNDLYEALEDFVDVKNADVLLVGEAKKGSASNRKHCLQKVNLDFEHQENTLYFRSSDIIKKFLTDIFYVQQKVLKPLGMIDFDINCKFETENPLPIFAVSVLDNSFKVCFPYSALTLFSCSYKTISPPTFQ